MFSITTHPQHSFHCNHFCIQCREFQPVTWMWEFRPVKKENQARNRKERSLQQFCVNNIGRRLTIRAENKHVIHTRSS
jgi:hypothetical protein